MVHMVFDYIIVDGASLRPTLGTGLNVYVGHDLLSLGSFCWRNENYTKPKPLPVLVLAFRRSLPGRLLRACRVSPMGTAAQHTISLAPAA
jgi:hypothetical protein